MCGAFRPFEPSLKLIGPPSHDIEDYLQRCHASGLYILIIIIYLLAYVKHIDEEDLTIVTYIYTIYT